MGKEIERKWREAAHPGVRYRQGYLSRGPERTVRVREAGDQAFITIKGKASGLTRPEFEYPIPLEDARELLDQLCVTPIVEKTRYDVSVNGHKWEIDEFEGINHGLLVAEIETENEDPLSGLPDWVGEEVTSDPRYLNANLVRHPFAEWNGQPQPAESRFHLKRGESVRKGLLRIVHEEVENAIRQFSNPKDLDEAVHEARKSIKRIRAVLRMLRPALGGVYQSANSDLRKIGQQLSALRDSQALLEIFDDLDASAFTTAREHLKRRRQEEAAHFDAEATLPALVDALREVARQASGWAIDQAGLSLLSRGLARTVRRGRKAFRKAYEDPRPERFHEWRKRAKDFRYQLELLQKAWPEVLEGYASSARELESMLGDDHNLAVLHDAVIHNPDRFGTEEEQHELLAHIGAKAKELRADAATLGQRIYGETPRQWRKRLEHCWSAWHKEHKHHRNAH